MTSPAELVAAGGRLLADAGVATPRRDAELLLDHVLGGQRRFTVTVVADGDRSRYQELLRRRATREPLQHLTGTAGFARLTLRVGPGVFVPRPETELLAAWAVTVLPRPRDATAAPGRAAPGRAVPGRAAPVVVDLCAGSGALGLAVAAERPDARVHLVEIDAGAVRWLRSNAADVPGARVVPGDATAAVTLAELDGTVDVVVANPPYVPDGTPVPPEVTHDPAIAVWGGSDGLATVRKVAVRAAALLRPGGWFGVEHDESHPEPLRRLLAEAGWQQPRTHTDLAGRPRFTTARKEP